MSAKQNIDTTTNINETETKEKQEFLITLLKDNHY